MVDAIDMKGSIPAHYERPENMVGYMPKKVLVAYSGGADSSLLLYLTCIWARESGTEVFAAHVDHGIREGEAERDREHCINTAEKLGVKCFVLCENVPAVAKSEGKSLEEAARDVRYRFFSEIMEKEDIPLLLTAHNADDVIETMIYRLAKGTSVLGLCGIPQTRKTESGRDVARPLLLMSKSDILHECEQRGISYVTDSTNFDISYARNRIRNNILPELRAINPAAAEAAARSARLIKQDSDLLVSMAEKFLTLPDAKKIKKLRELEPPILSRVIMRLYAEKTSKMLEEKHLRLISELIHSGSEGDSVSLPGTVRAIILRESLEICDDPRCGNETVDYVYKLVTGENYTEPSQFTPQIQDEDGIVYNLFTQVPLEFDKINGRLFLRKRIPGDRIDLGDFSKDVRKLMSEKRIPRDERDDYPIICDDSGIAFIPHVAERKYLKAKNKSGRVLYAAVYRGRIMKGEKENG